MVAQVVHPVVLQARCDQDVLEFLPDGGLGIVTAVLVGKNQIGKLPRIPQIAHQKPLLRLGDFVLFQHLHDGRSRSNDSGLAVFQGAEAVLLPLLPGLHQLLLHVDDAVLEIHAVPGEADQLADPHPGEGGRQEQRLEGVAFQRFEQLFLFRCVQGHHRLLHHLGTDGIRSPGNTAQWRALVFIWRCMMPDCLC